MIDPSVPLPNPVENSVLPEKDVKDISFYTNAVMSDDKSQISIGSYQNIADELRATGQSMAHKMQKDLYEIEQGIGYDKTMATMLDDNTTTAFEKQEVVARSLKGLPLSEDLRDKYSEQIATISDVSEPGYDEMQDHITSHYNMIKDIHEAERLAHDQKIASEGFFDMVGGLAKRGMLETAAIGNILLALPSFIYNVTGRLTFATREFIQNGHINMKEIAERAEDFAAVESSLYQEFSDAIARGEAPPLHLLLDVRLDPLINQLSPETQEMWHNTLINRAFTTLDEVITGLSEVAAEDLGGQKEGWKTAILTAMLIIPGRSAYKKKDLAPIKDSTRDVAAHLERGSEGVLIKDIRKAKEKLSKVKDKTSIEYVQASADLVVARIRQLEKELIAIKRKTGEYAKRGIGSLSKRERAEYTRLEKAKKQKFESQVTLRKELFQHNKKLTKHKKAEDKAAALEAEYETQYDVAKPGDKVKVEDGSIGEIISYDKKTDEYIILQRDPRFPGTGIKDGPVLEVRTPAETVNKSNPELGRKVKKPKPEKEVSGQFHVENGVVVFDPPKGKIKEPLANPTDPIVTTIEMNKPLAAEQAWQALQDGSGTLAEIFGLNIAKLIDQQLGGEVSPFRKVFTLDLTKQIHAEARSKLVHADSQIIRSSKLKDRETFLRLRLLDKILATGNKKVHIDFTTSNLKLQLRSIEGTFTFKPNANTYWTSLREAIQVLRGLENTFRDKYGKRVNMPYLVDNQGNRINIDKIKIKELPEIAKEDAKSWSRSHKKGYEVSSQGDKRFSALYATFKDGRTVEQVWQEAKGSGKGKPAVDPNFNYWETYLQIWRDWASENPQLMATLIKESHGKVLTDKFASTSNNQARALATIINEIQSGRQAPPKNIVQKIHDAMNETAKKWFEKEKVKATQANKFIGRGKKGSSTENYRIVYEKEGRANVGKYNSSDVVWISSNGQRTGRVAPTKEGALVEVYTDIDLAIEAGATLIMDTASHLKKTGRYNTGELALADYLSSHGYERIGETGTWKPKNRKTSLPDGQYEIRWDHKYERDPLMDQGKPIEAIDAPRTTVWLPFVGKVDLTHWAQTTWGNWLFNPGRIYAGWFETGRMLLGQEASRNYNVLTQQLKQNFNGVFNGNMRAAFNEFLMESERIKRENWKFEEMTAFIESKGWEFNSKQYDIMFESHVIWRRVVDYHWRVLNQQKHRQLKEQGFNHAIFDEQTQSYDHGRGPVIVREKIFDKDIEILLEQERVATGLKPEGIDLWNNPFEVWDFDAGGPVRIKAQYDKATGNVYELIDNARTGRKLVLFEKEMPHPTDNLVRYTFGIVSGNKYTLKGLPQNPILKRPGHTPRRNTGHYFVDVMPKEMTINGRIIKWDERLPMEGSNEVAFNILKLHSVAKAIGRTKPEADNIASGLYESMYPKEQYWLRTRAATESFRDSQDIQAVADEISGSSIGRRDGMQNHLGELAEFQDPLQTLLQATEGYAKYDAWALWRDKTEAAWIRDFGHLLDRDHPRHEQTGELTFPTSMDQIKLPSKASELQIQRYNAAKGSYERFTTIQKHSNWLVDGIYGTLYKFSRVFESGKIWEKTIGQEWATKVSVGLKETAIKSGAIEALPRKLTSTAFIALQVPFRHWMLQPQVYMEMMILNPKTAASTMRLMPSLMLSLLFEGSREYRPHAKAIRELVYKTSGKSKKEVDRIIKDVLDSGMLESIDSNMVITNLFNEGYGKLNYGTLESMYKGTQAPYKTLVKGFKTAGFTVGELSNRLGLWLTLYEKYKAAGKNVSDINITRQISKESLEISGAMTEAGAYGYQHLPILNLLTQFASISHKLTMMIFQDSATILTGGERAKLSAMRMLWYGPKYGAPLGIMIGFNNWLKSLDNESAQAYAEWADQGGLADVWYNTVLGAITGTDPKALYSATLSPYGHKAGGVVYDYFLASIGLFTGVTSQDHRYPSSHFYGRMGDAIRAASMIWRIDDESISTVRKLTGTASAIAKVTSGWSNTSKAAIILATGDKYSKLGQPYGLDLNVGEAWAQMLGFNTVREVEMWALAEQITDTKKRNKQLAGDLYKYAWQMDKVEQGKGYEVINQVINILRDDVNFSNKDIDSIINHFGDNDRKHFQKFSDSIYNTVFQNATVDHYRKLDGMSQSFIRAMDEVMHNNRWDFIKHNEDYIKNMPEHNGEID